ncbi:MAG TPA: hypothetical protein VMW24_05985 [Sedimentisphaerales bacterium]|nr:hypothetical protein [Sedimentisphaerales bacterium]
MTDDTDRLNEIRERLIPVDAVIPLSNRLVCKEIRHARSDIPWLLAKIDRLGTDANLACADLAEANRTIAELREQVKAADKVKQLWYMLDDALAAFRGAMEEDEATSNSDPTSSRLEDGEAVK